MSPIDLNFLSSQERRREIWEISMAGGAAPVKRSDVRSVRARTGEGRREQGWLNPSTPRRSSYLPQRDVGILYAGGGEQWGYSAGCKLMVSPWHDGGWARPKGSA